MLTPACQNLGIFMAAGSRFLGDKWYPFLVVSLAPKKKSVHLFGFSLLLQENHQKRLKVTHCRGKPLKKVSSRKNQVATHALRKKTRLRC